MRAVTKPSMRYVKIDPPGTICMNAAILDVVKSAKARSFVEVGCGEGRLSRLLCDQGLTGRGVDFSAKAREAAKRTLSEHIAAGRYKLHAGEMVEMADEIEPTDVTLSCII